MQINLTMSQKKSNDKNPPTVKNFCINNFEILEFEHDIFVSRRILTRWLRKKGLFRRNILRFSGFLIIFIPTSAQFITMKMNILPCTKDLYRTFLQNISTWLYQ